MNMKGFLIGAGLLAVVTAVIAMPYSDTVPRYLVNPGPLSQPHAFLEKRCSACHTSTKGVEASNCIVCHAISGWEPLYTPLVGDAASTKDA